ncbi:hypothetical protein E3N88_25677 [Mikania micrantha]|uniref:Cytochrome P450 n=1 Tax=Mikania micrantha TaxID=192012 RepID=A0A5N6N5F6_9ASTR|nr:hypothetical protein E3N88_25677 [Mikania micrantha]
MDDVFANGKDKMTNIDNNVMNVDAKNIIDNFVKSEDNKDDEKLEISRGSNEVSMMLKTSFMILMILFSLRTRLRNCLWQMLTCLCEEGRVGDSKYPCLWRCHLCAMTTSGLHASASILCFLIFGHLNPKRNDVKRINNGLGKRLPEVAGSWPIIGHLHLLSGSQVAHKVLGAMADKFGSIFTIKLGVHRVLVVCSSEMAKECLTTNDRVFASRPKAMGSELMGYNYASVGLAPHGPYWRMIRKLIVLELTSQHRLQMLARIKVSEVESSMMDIYKTWVTAAGSSERVVVDMKQWFGKLTVNMVVKMMFGNHFSPEAAKEELYGFNADDVVKSTCLALFAAATDTTEATLTWTLALLVNNPMTLKKAQQELENFVGKDRKVEESDMSKLVYLQAIIKESMRHYPVAPLLIPHESIEDCIVSGYMVPKGTRLLINIWKIHHDPQIWTNPFEFQPERFLTSKKEVDVKGRHFELIPFGSGRRMCSGISFAIESLQLILARIIHAFEFQNPSNVKINMIESSGIVNHKVGPFELLVAPRLSPQVYGFLD